MPARSKIAMLPPTMRTELERRIVERAFSGYQDLAEWLQAQGYHIAHDSLQRHGSRLQQKIKAMEQLAHEAEASTAAAHRACGNLTNVTIHLIHQRVLSMLLADPERSEGSITGAVPACAPSAEDCGAGMLSTERDTVGAAASPLAAESAQDCSEQSSHAGHPPAASVSDGSASAPVLGDLVRLTRIVADLNRITIARQRQDEEGSSHLKSRKSEAKGLSPETSQRLRNALLGIKPFEEPDSSGDSSSGGVSAPAPRSEDSPGDPDQES